MIYLFICVAILAFLPIFEKLMIDPESLKGGLLFFLKPYLTQTKIDIGVIMLLRNTIALIFLWIFIPLVLFKSNATNFSLIFSYPLYLKVMAGIAGILGSVFIPLTFYYGLLKVGPTTASLIVSTYPAMTAVFSYILLGEPLTLKKILSLIFIITGLTILSLK